MFFDGFTLSTRSMDGTEYRYRIGGQGPALMLIHGRPETHAMWHTVAPTLAQSHTVLCPDLHPELGLKRQAHDLLHLAEDLGQTVLAVAGHDVGTRVACQMAALAPERVTRLIAMEALPGMNHAGRDDMAFALAQYESCWFGQLHPKPESGAVPVPSEWLAPSGGDTGFFDPEAVADYLKARIWRNTKADFWPLTGLTLTCPILALWGARGRIGGWYDPKAFWEDVTSGPVSGRAIDAEHFLPEEAPAQVTNAIAAFLNTAA